MKRMDKIRKKQLGLFPGQGADFAVTSSIEHHDKEYASTFRRLYYHLYSNSRASRAERIMSDLANLLLCKVAAERNGSADVLRRFLRGEGTANQLLLPALVRGFPDLRKQIEPFSLEDSALRYGLRLLEPLSFNSASAHILGEAFQALIGPRLRGDKGQFFTPRSLVRVMIAVLNPPPTAKVVDPACGTGGFLVETHASQALAHRPANRRHGGLLIGMDKDADLCRFATALLQIVAPHRTHVHNVNSLNLAGLSKLPRDTSPLDADVVMTNPPFGARIKITDRDILRQYALGHRWRRLSRRWLQEQAVREAQDPQILFLELCIRLLKPGGQLGIVLPEGIFGNHSLGYVLDFVRSQGEITALIDCPRTTFQPSTDTKTDVLFFRKGEGREHRRGSEVIWTAVALSAGYDRRGRTMRSDGQPYVDDFQAIAAASGDREGSGGVWERVRITEPYYLVPRYYDKAPLKALEEETARVGATLVSLGQMVELGYLRIRKGHEVGAEAYGTGEIPFVRTSDISNYEVFADPSRGLSEEAYKQYADQQRLAPGNILLVTDGRYRIGRCAILHAHNYRCVVQSHIRILEVTPKSPIDSIELLYLLELPMVQRQIRNMIFIQSTLGALGRRLYEIRIPMLTQTAEWKKRIEEFRSLIEQRAALLGKLREFEHPAYDV